MAKLSVVILNWNGLSFLKKFIPEVVRTSNIPGVEVVVADNGSADESLPWLKTNFPSVKTIELDKNYGFTGGYNRALKEITSEYYLILNSDVNPTDGWLEPLIALMDDQSDVAACMPKIRSYDNPSLFEYAGAAGGFIDRFGFPFCRGRILSNVEQDFGQYDNQSEIFWATGACMMVRSSAYWEADGFDEFFFAHMEEIDLCWRLKNLGYKIMYVGKSTVFHVGGGTLPNNNPRKLFLNYRNNLILLVKNLPSGLLVTTLLFRIFMDLAAAIVFLLTGKTSFFAAIIKAYWEFYKHSIYYKSLRKKLSHPRRNNLHKEIFKGSIVFEFFLKKNKTFSSINYFRKQQPF